MPKFVVEEDDTAKCTKVFQVGYGVKGNFKFLYKIFPWVVDGRQAAYEKAHREIELAQEPL